MCEKSTLHGVRTNAARPGGIHSVFHAPGPSNCKSESQRAFWTEMHLQCVSGLFCNPSQVRIMRSIFLLLLTVCAAGVAQATTVEDMVQARELRSSSSAQRGSQTTEPMSVVTLTRETRAPPKREKKDALFWDCFHDTRWHVRQSQGHRRQQQR